MGAMASLAYGCTVASGCPFGARAGTGGSQRARGDSVPDPAWVGKRVDRDGAEPGLAVDVGGADPGSVDPVADGDRIMVAWSPVHHAGDRAPPQLQHWMFRNEISQLTSGGHVGVQASRGRPRRGSPGHPRRRRIHVRQEAGVVQTAGLVERHVDQPVQRPTRPHPLLRQFGGETQVHRGVDVRVPGAGAGLDELLGRG